MLYKLDRALPNHASALEGHAYAIRQHKMRIGNFEEILTKYISNRNQDTVKLKKLLKEHKLQEAQHKNEQQRHKTFRTTHLKAMAELMRITKLLESTE